MPEPAPRWLDCARDFTEYWTHPRQLRDATGIHRDRDPAVDHVAIDTFLRAVPHTLHDTAADHSASVAVVVTGAASGGWRWRHDRDGWRWIAATHRPATATLTADPDMIWRLRTRGIDPTRGRRTRHHQGDRALGTALLRIVSIIRE